MIYVISDLHGYPLSRFLQLLKKADFSEDDFLFILGDVIDRNGDGGVEMLRWLLWQSNVELLLGNHEAMLLSCDFVFDEITEQGIEQLTSEKMSLLMNYMRNGGDVTLKALRKLAAASREELYDILDYLREAPLYETVSADGRDFLLVHAGFENFRKDRKLSDYSSDELLWARPAIDENYFNDVMTVFGHTPTDSYGAAYEGKILKTATWINIDAGAASGNEPILLRLDDMAEFSLTR